MSRKATLSHLAGLGEPVVIVAVTDQKSCDRLIRAGARQAQDMGVGLKVVSVQPFAFLGLELGLNLDYLYGIAKEYGAEMSVFYHDDPLQMIGAYIRRHNTRLLIAGTTPGGYEGQFISELRRAFPKQPVCLVDPDGLLYDLTPLAFTRGRARPPKLRPATEAE